MEYKHKEWLGIGCNDLGKVFWYRMNRNRSHDKKLTWEYLEDRADKIC